MYSGPEKQLLMDTFGAKGLYESVAEENTPDPMLEIDPDRLNRALPGNCRMSWMRSLQEIS